MWTKPDGGSGARGSTCGSWPRRSAWFSGSGGTRRVAEELLGEGYEGTAVTDRYASYRWLPDERHQVCWAHLNRDFEALIERGGAAKRVGKILREVHDDRFATRHAYKRGQIRRETMQRRMIGVETRLGEVLEGGASCRDPSARKFCNSLLTIESSLFVFARIQDVEPTNNIGERGIRPAVQWRKICFGTQSLNGSRFVERILTVVATCRLQDRPLLPYLRDVLVAADSDVEIPSLLRAPAVDRGSREPLPVCEDTRLRDAG